MFKIVIDPAFNDYFCKWLANRFTTPTYFDPQTTRTIAHVYSTVDKDGVAQVDVLAVAAIHNWRTHSCEVTLATSGEKRQKATGDYIRAVLGYVFDTCNRTSLYATIASDNAKSIGVANMLGFSKTGEIPDFFGEKHCAYVYALTKTLWKTGPWRDKAGEAINIGQQEKDTVH